MTLAYVLNPLDRRANDRPNAAWIAGQRQCADVKLIRISGDATLIRDGALVTDNMISDELTVFLGLDSHDTPWFACRSEPLDGMRDLRSLAMEEALPPEQLGMLAQARALIQWHERRRFCSNCAAPDEPDLTNLLAIGITGNEPGAKFMRGRGCDRCQGTGYKGRQGLYEFLVVDEEIRRMTVERTPSSKMKAHAIEAQGMRTLLGDGRLAVLAGKTTPEEVMRVSQREDF